MLEVTDWARDILSRSVAAARRFDDGVIVRVVPSNGSVTAELADAPAADDRAIEGVEGAFAADGVEGQLDIEEPHAQLVLKPAGSEPNPRAHD